MGNCCRRESTMVWASVDEIYDHSSGKERVDVGSDGVNGADEGVSTPLMGQQIKIKVTKKELEEMVAIARLQGVPVDRVLSRLIHAVDHSGDRPRRPWGPVLDTIAE